LFFSSLLGSPLFCFQVSDFGLARWKEYSRTKSKKHSPEGTVTHISPQLWENINKLSESDDVYGYGILLWEIATQQVPFCGPCG
jgi:sterile alpha motif and leucine zipper-containing kinase AZK